MTKADRQKVFDKYGGKCAYCGCELNDRWQVDHAVSKQYWYYFDLQKPKAVNCMENLMPSCRECNHYKREHCVNSSGDHIGFRDYMLRFHIRLGKLPKKTIVDRTKNRIVYMNVIAAKYGITPDKPFNGTFYFETLTNKPNRR